MLSNYDPCDLPVPREIICFIAEYLNPRDCASFSLACKEIHRTIDHLLWKNVTVFSEAACVSVMRALDREPRRKENVKCLDYRVNFKSLRYEKSYAARLSQDQSSADKTKVDASARKFDLSQLSMFENIEEITVKVKGWMPPWHERYPTREDWMVSINMWDDQASLNRSFDAALRGDAPMDSLICDRSMPFLKTCHIDFGVVNLGPTACWSLSIIVRIFFHPTLRSLTLSNAAFVRTPFHAPPHAHRTTPLTHLAFHNSQLHLPYLTALLSLPRGLCSFTADTTRGTIPLPRSDFILSLLARLTPHAATLTTLRLPALNDVETAWHETPPLNLSPFTALRHLTLDSAAYVASFPPALTCLTLYLWGAASRPRVQYVWGSAPEPRLLCPLLYDAAIGPRDLRELRADCRSLQRVILATPDSGYAVPVDLRCALSESEFEHVVEWREFGAPVPSYYRPE